MSRLTTLALTLVSTSLFVVGCSDSSPKKTVKPAVDAPGGGGDDDAPTGGDDAPTGGDAPAAGCTAEASYPAPTQLQYLKGGDNDMAPGLEAGGPLNADAAPDIIDLQFWGGYGAFANGYPTGPTTINLAGPESDFATCGACIFVITDVTQQGAGGEYLANAGTLDITSLSDTSIAGTLSGVTLRHVDIAMDGTTTNNADNCTTSVATLQFSGTPTMRMNKSGVAQPGWRLHVKR